MRKKLTASVLSLKEWDAWGCIDEESALMRRVYCVLCMFLVFGTIFTGCGGSFKADENAIKISKDGKVFAVSVEDLEKDYYDEAELEEYIDALVDEYNSSREGAVKKKSFKVKEETANLSMEYESAKDYEDFNGTVLFSGTVAKAIAEGYEFDTSFVSIKNGESADGIGAVPVAASDESESADASGDASGDITFTVTYEGDTDGEKIRDMLDSKVVILSEDLLVTVPGEISYVSADGTMVIKKDTVKIKKSSEGLSYIIYD